MTTHSKHLTSKAGAVPAEVKRLAGELGEDFNDAERDLLRRAAAGEGYRGGVPTLHQLDAAVHALHDGPPDPAGLPYARAEVYALLTEEM